MQRLEVCLGQEHIPVGVLTTAQREMARASARQTQLDSARVNRILLGQRDDDGSGPDGDSHGGHWLVNRSTHSTVKAFSGTGHTLGGSDKAPTGNATSESTEQLSVHHEQRQQVSSERKKGAAPF